MAIAEPITPEQAAEELLRRRKAADSLHEYMRQAWPQVESGRPFKDNWHIGAIAEHLEAVTTGQIRNLLINQPPRTTKSLTVAVFWPSWVWIKHPEIQWLFASYSHTLSLRDSRRCRSLIKSGWYQARWGNRYSISDVSDTLLRYDNDKSGYRVSTSVDGTNTGEGGDIIVCLPYEALVLTDSGWLRIGDIVERRLQVKILSWNHAAGAIEGQPVEAYEKNPGKDLIEITTPDGLTLTVTTDHPVYVRGRGYIKAEDIGPGDEVMVNADGLPLPDNRP